MTRNFGANVWESQKEETVTLQGVLRDHSERVLFRYTAVLQNCRFSAAPGRPLVFLQQRFFFAYCSSALFSLSEFLAASFYFPSFPPPLSSHLFLPLWFTSQLSESTFIQLGLTLCEKN